MTTRVLSALALLAAALLDHGCAPAPPAKAHYTLGSPYQAGGVWRYPRESYSLDETGLATVNSSAHASLTSDGEVFDQNALAASHATLQLPAIARLTNLENGRALLVRINDRGTGDPHRLVEVTRRVASLLGMSEHGATRVRLEVQETPSRDAVEAVPGAPRLAVDTAPRGAVEVAALPPPPGARQESARVVTTAVLKERPAAPAVSAPQRLPETVIHTAPRPGELMVRLDTFEDYQYAAVQRARMGGLGARIVPVFEGRTHKFRTVIGPIADVRQADATLDRALAAGIPDARIVVE